MKSNQNLVVFRRNQPYNSEFLSIVVGALDSTARMVFLFIILDGILNWILGFFQKETTLFAIEGIWDVVGILVLFLLMLFLSYKITITKVDVQNRILHLRSLAFLSLVAQKNIMEIECITVYPNRSFFVNVLITSKGECMKTKINVKEYSKFISLLQELNPSIEVEYKE